MIYVASSKRFGRPVFALFLALGLGVAPALAQDAAPTNPPPASETAAAAPVAPAPVAPKAAAPAPAAPAATAPVAAVEPAPAPAPVVASDSPLKISGYVQAQFTHSEESKGGVKDASKDPVSNPNNRDKFEIRRGRLKLVYTKSVAELVFQMDATSNSIALRDAEASVIAPWTDSTKTKFTVGLFKPPYSYDTILGSQSRWFPERSQLAQRFFPGERDVGARVSGDLFEGTFNYGFAVVNGQMIGEKAFPGLDPNKQKDVLAHFGIKKGPFSAGIAGYYGTGYVAPAVDDAATPATEAHDGINYTRWSYGPDVRFNYEIPKLGLLDIYAEIAYAQNMARGTLTDLPPVKLNAAGNATGDVQDHKQLAWYVAVNQKIGKYAGVAFRAEQFTLDLDDDKAMQTNVEPAVLAFFSDNVWLSFSYVRRMEDADVDNDQLWARLQAKYSVP